MDSSELLQGALVYIEACAPFILVFVVIACAGELIGLIKRAVSVYRKRGEW